MRLLLQIVEGERSLEVIDRNLFVEEVYYDSLTNDYLVVRKDRLSGKEIEVNKLNVR